MLLLQLSENGEGIDSNNRQQKVLVSTQPLLARISDMNKMKKKGKMEGFLGAAQESYVKKLTID